MQPGQAGGEERGEQLQGVAVADEEIQLAAGYGAQLGQGARRALRLRQDAGLQALQRLQHRMEIQVFLVFEIQVQGAFGQTRFPRHRLQCRRLETLAGEHLPGGLEDGLFPVLPVRIPAQHSSGHSRLTERSVSVRSRYPFRGCASSRAGGLTGAQRGSPLHVTRGPSASWRARWVGYREPGTTLRAPARNLRKPRECGCTAARR